MSVTRVKHLTLAVLELNIVLSAVTFSCFSFFFVSVFTHFIHLHKHTNLNCDQGAVLRDYNLY